MPILFAFREDRFGFRFEIGDHAVLGRSPDCDLILFDRATSRHHAEITKTDNGYTLKDLGSTNGTYHNDSRLEEEVTLKRNDEIRVGQEILLFDPDLDVAVGPEGAVLMVGDVEESPEGMIYQEAELDLASLDRNCLAPLFQVATALSHRPKRGRMLKQTAYAVTKIFGAERVAMIWPETSRTDRLTALLVRSEDRRISLPQPMVDLVLNQNMGVVWPYALSKLDFVNGERLLGSLDSSVMAAPLKAHGDLMGLLYLESSSRTYNQKDLNFLLGLTSLIGPAMVNASLIDQLDYRLSREEEEINSGSSFVGEDPQIKALLGTASQVAQTESRILLTGEVGTGKEVLARRIHSQSQRRRGPFISVNCSLLAPGQMESALFGQEAGAFSDEGVPGLLEQADSGTVFIRHVDHLSLQAQVELLRAVEEKVVYRIGSPTPRPINIRTISSSSVDLWRLVQDGEFREDLYDRLAEVTLEMPPLRNLKDDIIRLATLFLSRSAHQRGLPPPDLDGAAADCLRAYPWPGNVGELKNVTERLVMFSRKARVVVDDLPPDLRLAREAFKSFDGEPESETLAEVEKILIRRALARSNGTVELAAEILGLSENVLTDLSNRYQIALDAE